MAPVKPEAQELFQEVRASLRPSAADCERVLQALLPQIGGSPDAGDAAGPSGAAPTATTAATKATLVKAFAVLVGLGLSGGGLFLALRSEPSTETPAIVAPTASPQPAPPAEPPKTVAAPEIAVPAMPAAEVVKRPAATPHAADRLTQEVAILSHASAELRAGRPEAALVALADHQRRFPAGVLSEERTGARIQALCALGRTKEAKAELARLARTSPNSPYEGRARKACGFAPTDGE